MGVFHIGYRDGGVGDAVVDHGVDRDGDRVSCQHLKYKYVIRVDKRKPKVGQFLCTIMDIGEARREHELLKIDYLLGWHA